MSLRGLNRSCHSASLCAALASIWLLAVSCGDDGGPTDSNDDDSGAVPETLRVDRFAVAAGETRAFRGATVVIASNGVAINGDVLLDGSVPGDFHVICEAGTLAVNGRIAVDDASPALRRSGGRRAEPAAAAAGKAIVLEAPPANPVELVVGATAALVSGNGESGEDVAVTSNSGRFEAEPGGAGGDIVLRAPGGRVTLPSRAQGADAEFTLGAGGRGGDILVAPTFDGNGTTLEIIAGRGGNSGRLVLEAREIANLAATVARGADYIDGGLGGEGGHAGWDNVPNGLSGETSGGTRTYPLQEIVIRGGNGGDGAREGGDGGIAGYWAGSGRVINERGTPVATVAVFGGAGGNVFGSPVPVSSAMGGEGGPVALFAHAAWNGAPADTAGPRDGGDGGTALARGGDGGDVLTGVRASVATAGGGARGQFAFDQFRNAMLVLYPELAALGTAVLALEGVGGGDGGNGTSRCDGCAGGGGGRGGMVFVDGGRGGDVLASAPMSFGGPGGDIRRVRAGRGGRGGNGDPPGEGGPGGSFVIGFGAGGNGGVPGAEGQLLLDPELPGDPVPGELCGEQLECSDSPDPDSMPCGADGTGEWGFRSELVRSGDRYASRIEMVLNYRYTSPFASELTGGSVKRYSIVDGRVLEDTTIVIPAGAQVMPPTSADPVCTDVGVLEWPDGPGIVRVSGDARTTYWFSGCYPGYVPPERRNAYRCVADGAGGWRVEF